MTRVSFAKLDPGRDGSGSSGTHLWLDQLTRMICPWRCKVAKFFATPTAVRQWIDLIDPGATYEQALGDLLAYADTVSPAGESPNGAPRYRGPNRKGSPRPYVLVDEYQRPLPAIVAVLRPHAGWTPGKPRGRTVSEPGQPFSEGQPEVRARVPRAVKAWVDEQGPGWLARIVIRAYEERAHLA